MTYGLLYDRLYRTKIRVTGVKSLQFPHGMPSSSATRSSPICTLSSTSTPQLGPQSSVPFGTSSRGTRLHWGLTGSFSGEAVFSSLPSSMRGTGTSLPTSRKQDGTTTTTEPRYVHTYGRSLSLVFTLILT